MAVETIKMSSKGQIVIPQDIREILNVGEGSIFAVFGSKEGIILKKIDTPSKENLIKELKKIAEAGAIRAEKLGIKENDVSNIVHRLRKEKR
ncbi:MAG: AbrB/MazE/SpoVT family DNA-binding domain-containing protein [Nanoarchaeota archaeon]